MLEVETTGLVQSPPTWRESMELWVTCSNLNTGLASFLKLTSQSALWEKKFKKNSSGGK